MCKIKCESYMEINLQKPINSFKAMQKQLVNLEDIGAILTFQECEHLSAALSALTKNIDCLQNMIDEIEDKYVLKNNEEGE